MLRIAVCDDMQDFLLQVEKCIEMWDNAPERPAVCLFTDADAMIAVHSQNPFDIILLDVVMPLLSGIEAAREIRQQDRSVKIVFLTSSPEFAVDSYRVKADDYLLKPLDPNSLYRCLEELTEELHRDARSIVVKGRNAVHRVELKNIEFIESDNKYIHFSLTDGSVITSPEPLYIYESKLLLRDGFFKCSRGYLVNIYQIDNYSHKEIKMRSGCRVPISRSCHKEFETAYFSVLFGRAGEG